jgi:prophage regulatory protein
MFDNQCPDSLLSIQHIRSIINVSDVTLFRWIRGGKFPAPAKRMNRVRYWKAADIQQWLNQA